MTRLARGFQDQAVGELQSVTGTVFLQSRENYVRILYHQLRVIQQHRHSGGDCIGTEREDRLEDPDCLNEYRM